MKMGGCDHITYIYIYICSSPQATNPSPPLPIYMYIYIYIWMVLVVAPPDFSAELSFPFPRRSQARADPARPLGASGALACDSPL